MQLHASKYILFLHVHRAKCRWKRGVNGYFDSITQLIHGGIYILQVEEDRKDLFFVGEP